MHARQGYGPTSRLPERWVRVGPAGRWAGFTGCGLVGLAVAAAWTLALALATGRPAWLVLVLAGSMLTALLAVAAGEALLTGRPRLVCFHGEAAALTVAAAAAALAGLPVLATLDLAVPGLAIFRPAAGSAVGRGLLPRPPRRAGIRAARAIRPKGSRPSTSAYPCSPCPRIEATVLAVLAGVTTAVVLSPAPAGAALAGYLLVHVNVRFWLEFLRGDDGRPHLAGLSEAQWTALVVTVGLALAVAAGWPVPPLWLPLAFGLSLAAGLAWS